jgi:hypothetical protein
MIRYRRILLSTVVIVAWGSSARALPPVDLVTATYFGSGDASDVEGAAVADDGTIYIVGNCSAPLAVRNRDVHLAAFGEAMRAPRCGSGFVAHLSSDGRHILNWAQFGNGIALLTTVQTTKDSVYVSGYASEGLQDLIKGQPGLTHPFPLTDEIAAYEKDRAAGKEDKIGDRPGLGRYGAPCVLRLSADLAHIQAGTYLEGWQQVWDKKRVARIGKQMLGGYQEYYWQPTCLGILKSGEVLVTHDGGYFRMETEKDRSLATGDAKQLERYTFYDNCDYVSKLSADLGRRAWIHPIYTPPVDPAVAAKFRNGWKSSHYGSPRTHRMRLDAKEFVYLCGWSASATSNEPWWSPYLYKLDPETGEPVWKAYEYNPMSGSGNRMGGQVADTACVSLAIGEDGNVLSSLLADGGNTVMEWSPKADGSKFEEKQKGGGFGVKLVHWWGQVHRLDSTTRQGLGGARIGPWGWAADLTSLPGNAVLAWGRYNGNFDFTPDAWWSSTVENPNAFIRIYSADFDSVFSTSVPGVVPFEAIRAGNRIVLVGRTEQGAAPVKDALFSKSAGRSDGYLMVLDWRSDKRH